MATVLTPSLARSRSVFYTGMVLALMLVVFAGFMPGYVTRMGAGEPIPAFVHAHAAVFTAFLFVLLTQTLLIGAGRVDLHRRLGIAATVLALEPSGLRSSYGFHRMSPLVSAMKRQGARSAAGTPQSQHW